MPRDGLADGARARSGGRPPDPAKDDAILDGARAAFFENGFAGATMEEVAARAGVSKVTVYKRFADKESLFEAVVRREMSRMQREFETWPYADGSLGERLNAYGSILLRFLFMTQHRLLDRMLANDLRHSPGMGRRFYDLGPGACRERIGAMLADAAARGEIQIDDPHLASADLFSLWAGALQKELDFEVMDGVDGDEIDRRVRRGTRLFLKMTRPDR